MSVAKHAARAGAAAFLLGLSLTAAPAVAVAEDIDGTATSPGATSGASQSDPTQRPSRAAGATPRAGVAQRSATPRPAAARQAAPDPVETARGDSEIPTAQVRAPRRSQGLRTPDTAATPSTPSTQSTQSTQSTVGLPGRTRVPPTAAAPDVPTPGPVATRPEAAVTTPAPVAVGRPAATRTPVALAGVTAATGNAAAASVFDVFTGLLAPIRELFEGIALLVRRTFFNQAPTLNPVQLTGLSEGPITGNIGAVDPEGDPLVLSIAQSPRYGSAVIAADGSYTYTPDPAFAGVDSFIVEAADTGFHINLLDWFRPASTAANVGITQGAPSAMVTFQFVYGAGSEHWSSVARSTLEFVATTLAASFVVSSPVTLTYDVTGEFSPFSSTLASAGSDLTGAGPGFLRTVVQDKILAGTDANGSAADGTISWNFGSGWGFGNAVPSSQYDFQSTAMHELLHTFGFLSNVVEPGANTQQGWTAYDGYLVTSGGTAVIGGDYTWNTAYDLNLTGGNGGLFFGGPTAVAAYGGFVPLFTPGSWDAGSSVSHLDDSTFTGANEQLMNAQSSRGLGIRVISPIEAAILTDLGYTVVPGSGAAWAFIGVVFVRRRRRRD